MISATSTLLYTLSAMLCSPRRTRILEAAKSSVQWAAVSTWVEEIRVPPQKGVRPFLLTSPTWGLTLSFFCSLFRTDLPGVFVFLGLLTTDNTTVGSTTLNPTLQRQSSVKMFKIFKKVKMFKMFKMFQMLRPGKFLGTP